MSGETAMEKALMQFVKGEVGELAPLRDPDSDSGERVGHTEFLAVEEDLILRGGGESEYETNFFTDGVFKKEDWETLKKMAPNCNAIEMTDLKLTKIESPPEGVNIGVLVIVGSPELADIKFVAGLSKLSTFCVDSAPKLTQDDLKPLLEHPSVQVVELQQDSNCETTGPKLPMFDFGTQAEFIEFMFAKIPTLKICNETDSDGNAVNLGEEEEDDFLECPDEEESAEEGSPEEGEEEEDDDGEEEPTAKKQKVE